MQVTNVPHGVDLDVEEEFDRHPGKLNQVFPIGSRVRVFLKPRSRLKRQERCGANPAKDCLVATDEVADIGGGKVAHGRQVTLHRVAFRPAQLRNQGQIICLGQFGQAVRIPNAHLAGGAIRPLRCAIAAKNLASLSERLLIFMPQRFRLCRALRRVKVIENFGAMHIPDKRLAARG